MASPPRDDGSATTPPPQAHGVALLLKKMQAKAAGARQSYTLSAHEGKPLGVSLAMDSTEPGGRAVIYAVRDGSSAATSGLQPNSFLSAVDGQETAGLGIEEIQRLILAAVQGKDTVVLEATDVVTPPPIFRPIAEVAVATTAVAPAPSNHPNSMTNSSPASSTATEVADAPESVGAPESGTPAGTSALSRARASKPTHGVKAWRTLSVRPSKKAQAPAIADPLAPPVPPAAGAAPAKFANDRRGSLCAVTEGMTSAAKEKLELQKMKMEKEKEMRKRRCRSWCKNVMTLSVEDITSVLDTLLLLDTLMLGLLIALLTGSSAAKEDFMAADSFSFAVTLVENDLDEMSVPIFSHYILVWGQIGCCMRQWAPTPPSFTRRRVPNRTRAFDRAPCERRLLLLLHRLRRDRIPQPQPEPRARG